MDTADSINNDNDKGIGLAKATIEFAKSKAPKYAALIAAFLVRKFTCEVLSPDNDDKELNPSEIVDMLESSFSDMNLINSYSESEEEVDLSSRIRRDLEYLQALAVHAAAMPRAIKAVNEYLKGLYEHDGVQFERVVACGLALGEFGLRHGDVIEKSISSIKTNLDKLRNPND